MKRILTSLLIISASFFPVAVQAESPFGVFTSIEDMEQRVHNEIMGLDFEEALLVLDPKGRSLSQEQKDNFINVLSTHYKKPLTHHAMLKEEVLQGGFRQVVFAYWLDDLPIYIHLVTHQREGEVWLLKYNINTAFSEIVNEF